MPLISLYYLHLHLIQPIKLLNQLINLPLCLVNGAMDLLALGFEFGGLVRHRIARAR